HELMEMQAHLAVDGHGQVERIHQEALAAPDAAPQVDPARHGRAQKQLFQAIRALALELDPVIIVMLQALDRCALGFVGDEAPLAQGLRVIRADIHGQKSAAYRFSVRLSTARAASLTASDRVGCAWQMRAMSSAAPRNSMMVTASAISSEAIGPTMCTPSTSSVLASARILTKPVVSPSARARPLAMKGKLPAL